MKEQILDFIKRRWQKDADWCSGNCWWFAQILIMRFEFLELYYLPIEGHFIVKDNEGNYYDWTGLYIPKEQPIEWKRLLMEDPLWSSHIIRDCMV